MRILFFVGFCVTLFGCKTEEYFNEYTPSDYVTSTDYSLKKYSRGNVLDYTGIPDKPTDRTPLSFSDEGAWFSYGFSDSLEISGGFTGPFLMTQENGVWSSPMLSKLTLINEATGSEFLWQNFERSQVGFTSHLEQIYDGENLQIEQRLFFDTDHSAMIQTIIKNRSQKKVKLTPNWSGELFEKSLSFQETAGGVQINSSKSDAMGLIEYSGETDTTEITDTSYKFVLKQITLKPGENTELFVKHYFIFKDHNCPNLLRIRFKPDTTTANQMLQSKMEAKDKEMDQIFHALNKKYQSGRYFELATKCYLTLQNNWRTPSGQLKHAGVFPSYHYEWFHGFWAWDSWKHAVALARFNPEKAKDQIRAMYDFQEENGFIPDCIYRDTLIEKHNYRNTKAPLSAWAVWKVYELTNDRDFAAEMYPKLVKQHLWWYENRDHDNDGLCEYGSTDGTLIAAKWESGMDNAVRFDSSHIVKNKEGAYSLNQESVDLNAYLAAEKEYLSQIALAFFNDDYKKWEKESETLNNKIQDQFFDAETGWFYDTNLEGTEFIKVMGCEGWIPLWANAATAEQAESVKNNMMDTSKFYTKVPFQTLSADHPKFRPNRGYWRGPNWLDQAYFGVKGLHNYGFNKEGSKATSAILFGCEGLFEKGTSIRENYNPITGEGMEAHNFSWSAAHILMILTGL